MIREKTFTKEMPGAIKAIRKEIEGLTKKVSTAQVQVGELLV